MLIWFALLFFTTYAAIALERPLKINKSASALIGAGLLWTAYGVSLNNGAVLNQQLGESLMGTAQVVFFLMGAMTIVEVIDAHNGFEVITSFIRTKQLTTLMWMVGFVTFFLSSILDNLTTTIVMISLMERLLAQRDDRLTFAGIIIIAANAGGAWTPIGDVTTTMLWIGGQVSTFAIVQSVFLPALVNLMVPLLVTSQVLGKRTVIGPKHKHDAHTHHGSQFKRNLMLGFGLTILVLVPIFRTLTGLPPFMGILFGLGLLWFVGDMLYRGEEGPDKQQLTLARALTRIDMGSLVFFIGILLAVAVLGHTHILSTMAHWLDRAVGRQDLIVLIIGLVSALVDNVPLVAASMGMYSLDQYPPDSFLWQFIAYCTGTGGSILIIGSAAGVVAMGIEKIDFFWYLRNFSGLALVGYLAGALVYIGQYHWMHY